MKIEELKKSKQWLNWKRVDEGKRITKIPYCYKGYMTGADQNIQKIGAIMILLVRVIDLMA